MTRREAHQRSHSRRSLAVLTVAAVALAACSSGDDDSGIATADEPTTDAGAPDTEVADVDDVADSPTAGGPIETPDAVADDLVAGAAVAVSTVEEFDRVRFDGIDTTADLSELELFMYAAGVDPVDLILFLDDEGLYTSIGMYPADPGVGGPVELQFVNGDGRSAAIPLELTGVPPAPGAWDTAVDTMVAELAARANAAGTSLDELAATSPEQLDPDMRIIKLVAGYIDDGTENDLESLLVAPGNELDEDEVALVDAIVNKIGPLALVPGGVTVGPTGFAPTPQAPRPYTSPRSYTPAPAQAGECMQFPLNITNSEQLIAAMATGVGAQRTQGGAVDKLVQDVSSLAKTTSKIPVVGQLVGTVETMYATMDLWYNADAGRYPTSLTAITAELSIDEFNEDYTKTGNVTSVSLTAASTGFDASKEFSQIASAAANAAAGAITGKAKEGVGTLSQTGEQAIKAGEKLRDSASGKLIKELGDRYLQWCADTWTVNDAAESNYVKISPVLGLIKVEQIGLIYEPTKLGNDFLKIRARADKFSGQSISVNVPVSTNQLQVVGSPSIVLVRRAGEALPITAELRNADTETLDWDPGKGTWNDGTGQETNGPRTRPLLTPTNKNAYPFPVTIKSTSKTGLRADATDERSATVWVELQGLIVEPDPGSVRVRQPLPFFAFDSDGNAREVTWTATGGEIDANGLYIAGNEPGVYTVTATAVDDPSVVVTVQVTITDAECLLGTWLLRSQEFLDQIGAASGAPGTISYRSGEYRLVIGEDGTYTGYRDQWSFRITTPEGTLAVMIDSVDPGAWSATETELTVNDFGSEATVTFGIEVGGQIQPLPINVPQTAGTDAFSGTGAYECDGDVMTGSFDGFTAIFDRIG